MYKISICLCKAPGSELPEHAAKCFTPMGSVGILKGSARCQRSRGGSLFCGFVEQKYDSLVNVESRIVIYYSILLPHNIFSCSGSQNPILVFTAPMSGPNLSKLKIARTSLASGTAPSFPNGSCSEV